jgi:CRISPR system Cascade subunit CasE
MSWLTQLHIPRQLAAEGVVLQTGQRLRLLDTYDWHQAAWHCFPGRPAATRDFLTRLDQTPQGFRLLLVSTQPTARPDWCPPEAWQSREIPDGYFGRTRYAFQLRANPTKKIIDPNKPKVVGPDGRINRNKNARRIPLRQPADLVAWLERKAATGGFAVEADSLRLVPEGQEHFNRGREHGTHASVEFRGTLCVTDAAAFHRTFQTGLGSGKAFGFGLLVIAPVN